MTQPLHRETATHAEDLPHAFRGRSGLSCEVCGEKADGVLHQEHERETASEASGVLQREIGS